MTKNRRIKLLLIIVTVLSLGAGLMAGLLTSRLPVGPTTQAIEMKDPLDHTPLVEELNLSPAQREQMKQIWESAKVAAQGAFSDAEKLQKGRDEEILKILTDEQKAQFEKISKDFAGRYDQLQAERNKVFSQAVEKTLSLLNDRQKQKYQEILRTHVGPSAGTGTPR